MARQRWDLSSYPTRPSGQDSLIASGTRVVYTRHGCVLLTPCDRGTARTVFAIGVLQGYTYKGYLIPTDTPQEADWPKAAASFVRAARRLHSKKGRR